MKLFKVLVMMLKGMLFWFIIFCSALIICGIDSIMEMGYVPFAIAVLCVVCFAFFLKLFYTSKEIYICSGAYLLDKFINRTIWKEIKDNKKSEKED